MLPGRIRARGLSSASNEIWHSEKIRFACKFSLRSVHEGFAGFGAGCSLLPRAAPGSRPCFGCARPSAPELAPLLPKITPQAWGSESWGCHLPVEGKRRRGWVREHWECHRVPLVPRTEQGGDRGEAVALVCPLPMERTVHGRSDAELRDAIPTTPQPPQPTDTGTGTRGTHFYRDKCSATLPRRLRSRGTPPAPRSAGHPQLPAAPAPRIPLKHPPIPAASSPRSLAQPPADLPAAPRSPPASRLPLPGASRAPLLPAVPVPVPPPLDCTRGGGGGQESCSGSALGAGPGGRRRAGAGGAGAAGGAAARSRARPGTADRTAPREMRRDGAAIPVVRAAPTALPSARPSLAASALSNRESGPSIPLLISEHPLTQPRAPPYLPAFTPGAQWGHADPEPPRHDGDSAGTHQQHAEPSTLLRSPSVCAPG